MKQKFNAFYTQVGVYDKKPKDACPNSAVCWNKLSEVQKIDVGSFFYPPYIGENYELMRLLFLGLNMNGINQKDGAAYLAGLAIKEIAAGKKRTFKKSYYPGSLLWHRIFTYAAFFLRENGILPKPDHFKSPSIDEMLTAYDYLAMTNIVKCCPNTKNSEPTADMLHHCPTLFFKKEVGILNPKYIIALGKSALNGIKKVFPLKKLEQQGKTTLFTTHINDETMFVFSLPHPGCAEGTAKERQKEFVNLLKNTKKRKTIKIAGDTSLSSIKEELEKFYPSLKFMFIEKKTVEGDIIGSINMMVNDKIALCEALYLLKVLPLDTKIAEVCGKKAEDTECELKIDSSTSITDLINQLNQFDLTMAINFNDMPLVVVGGKSLNLEIFNNWANR